MKHLPRVLAGALLAALAVPAQAEIAIDVIGDYEVSLEGLMQADGNWYDNDVVDLNGPANTQGSDGNDTEFEMRRAEVILKGKGIKYDWVLGYDGKANKWLDNNIRWKMGTAYLQGGQYKQPNSLEELTSTRHNDFISKAMVTNLFGVARRVGVAYGVENPNWGFTASVFGRELTRNMAQGAGFGGRAYWAPWAQDGNFLHFGISAVDYDTDIDTTRLRVRPDADLALNRLIDTGNLVNTDRQTTFGLEGAWVRGPFKVQGEYMQSTIDRYDTPRASQPGDDFSGDSWYLYGLWNITGESWTYKAGLPVTPYPNNPSKGMWQLGLRYDSTDLNDNVVLGGEEQNITVGVNWYWRANFKFMLNYVDVSSSRFTTGVNRTVDDDPSILEVRAQFYW